jgi:hypothetical protein
MPSLTSSMPRPFARFLARHLFAIATTCFACALSVAATLPTMPQTFDATYVAPSGTMINVPAGGDFNAALNKAQLGDTIVLQAGATYRGPFTLPNKTTGTGWIYITSSAYSSLPAPGTRVGPSDAVNMPKIVVNAAGGNAVNTVANSHHYRFVGIEFTPIRGQFIYTLILIGGSDSSTATLANHIVIDRCYVHGDPATEGRRGIEIDGAYIAVVDSYVSEWKQAGYDTQAVWAYNTSGPLKLVNNHFEASAEDVMFGGADSATPALIPSDIEIRKNDFYKPLSWVTSQWTIKNLLELKNAQRVLIDGNQFQNVWAGAQNGFALVITPRNQSNTASWSVTQDITISNNEFDNVGSGVNVSGRDAPNISQVSDRVLIRNNVFNVVGQNANSAGFAGASGRIFQIVNGPKDVAIIHNTGFTQKSAAYSENNPPADQFVFTNNMLTGSFVGTGTGPTATLTTYYTNWTLAGNAMIGQSPADYPAGGAGNFFPANATAIQFANYTGGDYHLLKSSPYKNAATDGADIGADVDAIANASGAVFLHRIKPSGPTRP